MVTSTSCGLGAHRIHTVCGAGSSIALSSTFVVRSAMRSASSTTMTRRRPCEGLRLATVTRSRTSSILIVTSSVATRVTSGCVPARVVRHAAHRPQPPCSHCSAAANARAALERPEPGGPVSSHACVIAAGSVAAARNVATASS
ncbi:adenylate cyclase [Cellulosimicrobium cellulans J34]|nr:adenylate cyclase [Cellulosimicrobium cellulans J34]